MAKNNREKLFTYFKNLKFFFCLFLFISLVFFSLILNVNADSNVTGGGLPGYSIQSGSGGYTSQQNYYDIYKSFGGLGPGIGKLTNEDGTPMTEEQWKAKIEEYVESIAGMDLTEEQVVSGFYDFLGIESAPTDPTSPEYAALSSGLTGARTGDESASRTLAESIAAAAQAAAEDSAPPKTGDQPTADPSKEGTVDPKKDGENPGVAPEALEASDPTKSSANYGRCSEG